MKSINPKETTVSPKPYTRDVGRRRVLIIPGEEKLVQNQYFEVTYFDRSEPAERREIIYVRTSRIAYNTAIRAHADNLLNVVNLETGRLVVGAK